MDYAVLFLMYLLWALLGWWGATIIRHVRHLERGQEAIIQFLLPLEHTLHLLESTLHRLESTSRTSQPPPTTLPPNLFTYQRPPSSSSPTETSGPAEEWGPT